MTALAPDESTITFQNTGREHEKTLEFVRNVGDSLDREIVWLEFRPPHNLGDPPRKFLFERVSFATAARNGEPFAELQRSINAYRETCGKSPVAPWARGRICTVHLKHRVLDHYIASLGIYGHDRYIGIRADEPQRVPGLRKQETRDKGLMVPLYEAGVTKAMVLEFWARQSFDLGLPEYLGNCDGCFLKDYGDISRALGDAPERLAWWTDQQNRYPRFGGASFPRYEALAHELPTRIAIESALHAGTSVVDDGRLEPKHFKLVMLQERRRFLEGPAQFSCACEGSMTDEEDEDT